MVSVAYTAACLQALLDEGTSVIASNLIFLEKGKSKDSMRTNRHSSASSVNTSQNELSSIPHKPSFSAETTTHLPVQPV